MASFASSLIGQWISPGAKRADCQRVNISARDDTWVRLRSDKPAALRLNGRDRRCQHDQATGMLWLQVPAGKSTLRID